MRLILVKILFLATCLSASAQPLGIDDKRSYNLPPEISKFRHWYGDVRSGSVIYLGTEAIAGFETELHLHFFKNKISKILLILGPAGLDGDNCIKKYKAVVETLNQKYGQYKYQRIIKDPIVDDLIASSICTPIRLDLYDITTHWQFLDYTIVSSIIGDSDGWYLEIEYTKKSAKPENILKKTL